MPLKKKDHTGKTLSWLSKLTYSILMPKNACQALQLFCAPKRLNFFAVMFEKTTGRHVDKTKSTSRHVEKKTFIGRVTFKLLTDFSSNYPRKN